MMERDQGICSAALKARGHITVIDDDRQFRLALENLLKSVDFAVDLYASPDEFLASGEARRDGCILLDVRFPNLDGVDYLDRFRAAKIRQPVVLMTGYGDVVSSVRGLKGGALDYLLKPFDDEELLKVIQTAIAWNQNRADQDAEADDLRQRYRSLTCREQEVLELVCRGLMNKQIAGAMGLSEITAKVHRGTMMRKMGLRNVPDLVRAHVRLEQRSL